MTNVSHTQLLWARAQMYSVRLQFPEMSKCRKLPKDPQALYAPVLICLLYLSQITSSLTIGTELSVWASAATIGIPSFSDDFHVLMQVVGRSCDFCR